MRNYLLARWVVSAINARILLQSVIFSLPWGTQQKG